MRKTTRAVTPAQRYGGGSRVSVCALVIESGEQGTGNREPGGWGRASSPFPRSPSPVFSVSKLSTACQHHRDPVLVGRGDHFRIAHRATRLDDGGDACSRGFIHPVGKGEESIRGHHTASGIVALLPSLVDR